ncbi:xanthine dehydrogenase family protein molybdopterin-binding subunit [Paraburkholderia domus]|uniref:Isoquinoline 1-oxidoreductase subunit beta n=1 Tax=Paraburkholderia domus TaxID=2793075 RepID=A0A9N8MU18_9BURK|nr:xanthine dehydrogenase family protein molybdopterin-binding subunit [Paraburkholderia domus]MBK5121041.1 xanthine dehydrogenase family protein molybdopterin-binding subunit [Burkholderia sp. R-69980]MBK5166425.1 xanthine dehydrogenase family protein molybdopterin-binding subunit [Burkholderia sp. R-70211]MBK5185019.1 xanthine dehydrogenase family protein molybdopterin-binding subunit [Burkholderia sp. R-69749]MCI0146579.1 molybdopterin-dependent oxidoreductase [Paraburkholderia sediminicola]
MLKRRTFLLGGASALGALLVGWSVLPPGQRLTTSMPLPIEADQVALNGWVKIAADNTVTIVVCKAEMGQGIHTGLAMLLAEELDADWSKVRVENSPIDKIYNSVQNIVDDLPFRPDDDSTVKRATVWMTRKLVRDAGTMMTGGSSSINDLWTPMREAGASARAMLIGAAAEQWKVPPTECRTEGGYVLHGSGHKASFGELSAMAAQQPLPRKVALKDPAEFKLIGKPVRRIEAASKINGTARFGIDALPDGLIYASVVMCPTLGGTVAHFDASPAAKMPGFIKAIALAPYAGGSGAVAVIADNAFRAMNAVSAINVVWNDGAAANLSSAGVDTELAKALDDSDGHAYYHRGDVDAALSGAARTVTAEYHAPYLAHGSVEPVNCTVQVADGAATVWVSTQMPGLARQHVAKVLDIDADKVDVQTQLLGGAFGRRLELDFIAQAAAIAREGGGRPVQTIWSRAQDFTHDFYRPACVSRLKAGFDKDGKLVAWHATSASQAIVPDALARYYGVPRIPIDKTTCEGAFDQPYEWPTARVAHKIVELPVPIGFWRSVGHSHQAFFTEGFTDELAAATGQDPIAFRASLLAQHPRHLAVLRRVATLSDWGHPLTHAADGTKRARGVALHEAFGSVVAQVAEVSVGPNKQIRVHRVVCVIDCGLPVNPNLIRQQMESGIVFGLSTALQDEITIVGGVVTQKNFVDFPVVRMSDCPVIEVDIMPSQMHPQGVGEPGVPPIAPAVANAVFALTGQRLRALPLRLA